MVANRDMQLVFRQPTRGAPALGRGWHTPDPSPTRNSGMVLPGCSKAVICVQTALCEPHGHASAAAPHAVLPREQLPLRLCQDVDGEDIFQGQSESGTRTPNGWSTSASASGEDSTHGQNEDGTYTPEGHDAPGTSPIRGRAAAKFLPEQLPWTAFPVSRTPSRTPSPMARPPRTEDISSKLTAAFSKFNFAPVSQEEAPRSRAPSNVCLTTMPQYGALMTQVPATTPSPPPPMPVRMPAAAAPVLTHPPPAPTAPPTLSGGVGRKSGQRAAQASPPPPQPPAPSQGYQLMTSVGSVGHPFSCEDACKYARKPKGCKDGSSCTRCHHCEWNRHGKKRANLKRMQGKMLCSGFQQGASQR
eukprot:CAMPEP_0115191148 /NCGR_PEP_ID=MMETSP0270-20121206/12384_1 /TAXON_ID=71861 /ORGANISM="Scrippsiella trochoidea, Strain CCMP3099" /LENGTH=358 /DNA_ID=CAMNT_0002604367 /DNA_START=16 /DNA_END=1092 /DNA_ORIENTATION=+